MLVTTIIAVTVISITLIILDSIYKLKQGLDVEVMPIILVSMLTPVIGIIVIYSILNTYSLRLSDGELMLIKSREY